MKIFTTKSKNIILKILIIIFWIMMWEVASRLINRELYLPSVYNTLKTLFLMIQKIEFWEVVFFTISRVFIGFFISCIVGMILGIFCGLHNFAYQLFNPLIVAIKSTPVMSFIIVALIWFKSGNVPIFICFLMCVPIIWTSTVTGIKEVDQKLLEMAHVFKVRPILLIKNIYLPSIVPYLSTAMVTALGLGWKVTVAAEVLSSPKSSIGIKLYNAKIYLESNELFSWTIVVILLSLLFEYLFKYLITKITKTNHKVGELDDRD